MRLYVAVLVVVLAAVVVAMAAIAMQDRTQRAMEAAHAGAVAATVESLQIPPGMSACSQSPPGAMCWKGNVSPVVAMSAFKRSLARLGATKIDVACVAAHMGQVCSATAQLNGIDLSASAVPFIEDPLTKPRPGIVTMHVFFDVEAFPLPSGTPIPVPA